jgi:hypothetical protein
MKKQALVLAVSALLFPSARLIATPNTAIMQSRTNVVKAAAIPPKSPRRQRQTAPSSGTNVFLLASDLRKEITLTETGAKANFGTLQVQFDSDIGSARPVKINTPDGRVLRFRPTFLIAENRNTGESLLLGAVTNRIGELLPPSTLRWTNVLDSGPSLSLELVYNGNSLEQNVILSESVIPFLPPNWNLADVSLEFWSEWFSAENATLKVGTAILRPASPSSGQVTSEDQTISFGSTRIVSGGRAFTIGNNQNSIPVAKAWTQVTDGAARTRRFLIEKLDLVAAKSQMDALPSVKRQALYKTSRTRFGLIIEMASAWHRTADPRRNPNAHSTEHLQPKATITVAQSRLPSTGLLIDFQILNAVPLPAGAISWWPAGGDASDALSFHNDGMLYNTATFAPGYVGQGFSFDGSSYVTISDAPSLNPTNGLSFEGWVYLSEFDNDHAIFRKDGECGDRQYMLTVSPDQTFRAHVGSTNGNYYFIDSTFTVDIGVWYHVAMTYDVASSNLSLYVNGALNTNGVAEGAIIQTTQPLYIGGGHTDCAEYDFPGFIDEATFYDRALGATEIVAIYNAGAAGKVNPNCIIPSTNCVGWWPGDGNTYDIAHTNNGTLQNGTAYASGNVAQGFSFDGTNDYVLIPNNADLNPANQLTIEAWVYMNSYDFDPGLINYVIVRKDGECANRQYMVTASPNGSFRAHIGITNAGYYYIDGETILDARTWYHVAETYDGTNLCLYINGALDASSSVAGTILATTEPVCIGGTAPNGCAEYFLDGIVDEPSIYNRALSASEISSIYSAGCAGKCKMDSDGDGLTDLQELYLGTDPQVPIAITIDSPTNGATLN